TGQHDADLWNEDSVEFYVNATGDLTLSRYTTGVAQVTVPPLNIGAEPGDFTIGGVNGTATGATGVVVATENGWAVEMALPLVNDVWTITPAHGAVLGFQVHLNGASESNRDSKLVWSVFDTSDQSYQNPSVFGQLVFYEIGQTGIPTPAPLEEEVIEVEAVPADAPYLDPNLPIAERVEDLLARMTLEEKIGQMTLVEIGSIRVNDIAPLALGGLLSGGGGAPPINSPEAWAALVAGYQEQALGSRLGIPLIYGVDAVHGHNNVFGATIFPHNIGLGAANDPDLMREIGRVTALEMAATNIFWNYAPAVPVVQDIRWGRTYESYGERPELVTALAIPYLEGLQGDDLADPLTVAATVKHYVGDGGTTWGSETMTSGAFIDRGDTQVDEATLRAIHLPPYVAAVEAGARVVMASFSAWNGTRMHGNTYLLTDVLKNELGFTGFIVSDWAGMDMVAPDYYDAVVASINAGIDMNMVPYDYYRFIDALTEAVENGDVSLERIDDAVRRILTVKFELGLFEHPLSDPALLDEVGSTEHREVAARAVSESLVLLRNEGGLLPFGSDVRTVFLGGVAADDIGIQSGGWTISWQGSEGLITLGTTIFQGIAAATNASGGTSYYSPTGVFADVADEPDVCIAVFGERPYAEYMGDTLHLSIPNEDLDMIDNMFEVCDTLVGVIVAGRPVIITDYVEDFDALVMAWLPGSEGYAVAMNLFGLRPFTGRLPFTWPLDAADLPFDFTTLDPADVLYPFGYGLTTGE
ncbi:MAG: glycoside hydrolase family 3 C-terminal domain-containing protein, partial [Anaerolineae bacterium]|nr:glycoside hydrolase family 3 C-terminal domain-containing protein [Anaerolineae bacterium]